MNNFVGPLTAARLTLLFVVGVLVVGLSWPLSGAAQDKTADSAKHKHPDKAADAGKGLADQIRELQAKVAKLEAALKQAHQGTSSGMSAPSGMGGMQMGMGGKNKMGGMQMGKGSGMSSMTGMMDMDMMMGGMGDKKKGMGGMSGMAGMMDMDMMGMMGMGSMGQGSMSKMQMVSALPGFPGASHIYHIGATGFFLDHPEHITLTTEQETRLNRAKQKALLEKSKAERKVEEAEQELWELTGADQPDATQIEAKVREIEKLRGDQRLAFIRAVGEAAKVVTDEQRQVLLGTAKPAAHKHNPPPAK